MSSDNGDASEDTKSTDHQGSSVTKRESESAQATPVTAESTGQDENSVGEPKPGDSASAEASKPKDPVGSSGEKQDTAHASAPQTAPETRGQEKNPDEQREPESSVTSQTTKSKDHKDPLCMISMFLAGFIFFTPHRIAITCANHVVKRFHLPLGTVAMFVYRIHNLMELGSFAGTVINTIITLSSTKMGDKKTLKNCVSGISIWLMFIWSIITYFSFIAGGEYGYFGGFFWNIVILVFIYGVYSNSSMGIEGLNAPLYIVGLPLFGLFTFVFHKLYKYFYYIYFWDEYDYVLVLYQIWIMIILSFATSVVWTVSRVLETSTVGEDSGGIEKLFGMDDDGKEYHVLHWSPIFLVALSLGTVYFFYPAISPYQLVDDPFDGKKIELWIQAISATPHIAFAITQLNDKGPGRTWRNKWKKKQSCTCNDCCKTGSNCTCRCTENQDPKCTKCCCCTREGGSNGCCYELENGKEEWYALYHATWLFFIPYIICIYIFFSMMHFPEGRIGKYFRASVFRTGVLCVVFAWVQEFMEAVGFGGGMGAQVSGKCNDNFNADAGTIFGFMFLVFMVFFMFTDDLYLKLFINPMFP